jgi:hypothetical protein
LINELKHKELPEYHDSDEEFEEYLANRKKDKSSNLNSNAVSVELGARMCGGGLRR